MVYLADIDKERNQIDVMIASWRKSCRNFGPVDPVVFSDLDFSET